MVETRIKEVRSKKGITQTDIAKSLFGIFADGSTKVMISMIENGRVMPTPSVMRALCRELDCKPTDLYDAKDLDLRLESESDTGSDEIRIRCGYDKKKEIEDATETLGYAHPKEWFKEVVRTLLHEASIVNLMRRIDKNTSEIG